MEEQEAEQEHTMEEQEEFNGEENGQENTGAEEEHEEMEEHTEQETEAEDAENVDNGGGGEEPEAEKNKSASKEAGASTSTSGSVPQRARPVIPTKVYVGNLPETCRRADLLAAFEKFGKVTECDIVRNYAFVHYEQEEDAKAAVAALDDTDFQGGGVKIKVELGQISKKFRKPYTTYTFRKPGTSVGKYYHDRNELSVSKVRHKPLMGGKNECYRCGSEGHWSRDCPKGAFTHMDRNRNRRGPPPPRGNFERRRPPPYDPYLDALYERDMDPYYRRLPYPYDDPYERRRLALYDPYLRDLDPYERPPPDYYARRSPPPRDPYYLERRYPRLPPLPPSSRQGRHRVSPY